MGGLKPASVYALLSRPGVGRTALASQVALHVARRLDQVVAFVSPRIPARHLVLRLLTSEMGVPTRELVRAHSPALLETAPLFILDGVGRVETALAALRRQRNPRLGLVVIDDLDEMELRGDKWSGELWPLRSLARDLNVPVLLTMCSEPKRKSVMDSLAREADARLELGVDWKGSDLLPFGRRALRLRVVQRRAGLQTTISLEFDKPALRIQPRFNGRAAHELH